MLNYLWAFMILISVIYASFTGSIHTIGDAMIDSGHDAISLSITMLGIVPLWTGLMEVANDCKITDALIRSLDGPLTFLFPNIPKHHKAREYIATNMVSNLLGLGQAATPPGILAMESLSELNHQSPVASDEMCTFLVINISSLQLIPVNIIAYRSQYGSINPSAIIGASIMATAVSTLTGILFCKLKCRITGKVRP